MMRFSRPVAHGVIAIFTTCVVSMVTAKHIGDPFQDTTSYQCFVNQECAKTDDVIIHENTAYCCTPGDVRIFEVENFFGDGSETMFSSQYEAHYPNSDFAPPSYPWDMIDSSLEGHGFDYTTDNPSNFDNKRESDIGKGGIEFTHIDGNTDFGCRDDNNANEDGTPKNRQCGGTRKNEDYPKSSPDIAPHVFHHRDDNDDRQPGAANKEGDTEIGVDLSHHHRSKRQISADLISSQKVEETVAKNSGWGNPYVPSMKVLPRENFQHDMTNTGRFIPADLVEKVPFKINFVPIRSSVPRKKASEAENQSHKSNIPTPIVSKVKGSPENNAPLKRIPEESMVATRKSQTLEMIMGSSTKPETQLQRPVSKNSGSSASSQQQDIGKPEYLVMDEEEIFQPEDAPQSTLGDGSLNKNERTWSLTWGVDSSLDQIPRADQKVREETLKEHIADGGKSIQKKSKVSVTKTTPADSGTSPIGKEVQQASTKSTTKLAPQLSEQQEANAAGTSAIGKEVQQASTKSTTKPAPQLSQQQEANAAGTSAIGKEVQQVSTKSTTKPASQQSEQQEARAALTPTRGSPKSIVTCQCRPFSVAMSATTNSEKSVSFFQEMVNRLLDLYASSFGFSTSRK